tara:strand:- start:3806 stop:4495 length:690 start_codon:yes stop_codon:yes gene_type:complete
MSVFFVHDVNSGIVKPLDRKFRVREINPVQNMTESQAAHSKEMSDNTDFQSVYSKSSSQEQQSEKKTPTEHSQKAIQSYQENIPHSPKLSLGKVREIMSQPVIQIFEDQTLDSAWTLMQEHEIHHLIVLNERYQYSGLLSEKIIIPYLMLFAKNQQDMKSPESLALSYFCDQNLLSTHPETELYDLGIAMMEYGLDAAAVSEGSKIIGIVTKSDIFKVILKHQTFETLA